MTSGRPVCRCITALTSSLPRLAGGCRAGRAGDGAWLLDETLRPVGRLRCGSTVGPEQSSGVAARWNSLIVFPADRPNVIFAGATPALLHWCQAERGSMLDASRWLLSWCGRHRGPLTGQVATDPSAPVRLAVPTELDGAPGSQICWASTTGGPGLAPPVAPVVGLRGAVTPGGEGNRPDGGDARARRHHRRAGDDGWCRLRQAGDSMLVLATTAMSTRSHPSC